MGAGILHLQSLQAVGGAALSCVRKSACGAHLPLREIYFANVVELIVDSHPLCEKLSFMKGNPKVIEQLNRTLREELTAINQYFLHAEMCENWGYKKLSKYI